MEGIAERIGSVKKNTLSSGQRIDLTCILNNKIPFQIYKGEQMWVYWTLLFLLNKTSSPVDGII